MKRRGIAARGPRRECNHIMADIRDRRWSRWVVRFINRRMRRDGSRWELRIKRRKAGRMAVYMDLCRAYRRSCEAGELARNWAAMDGGRDYREVLRIQRQASFARDIERDEQGQRREYFTDLERTKGH